MHFWHDRTECYDRRFYPMGQESQVWARGSRLESLARQRQAGMKIERKTTNREL
ncbi:MAG: hypothetical protein KJ550_12295 [Proteobacteria bacterium]|nr:hypothetical protein [Pseudomonadota bacterium]MBU4066887.1 hypothetical protein [Pseudomonadota bacterium]MBU4099816.1 hypothetical protein [Pseudomonadota bacterium]MBU4126360.1 hypothetical protein [Pseudomonadota bacterium]